MKAFLAENAMRTFTFRGERPLTEKTAKTGATSFAPIRSGLRKKRVKLLINYEKLKKGKHFLKLICQ